MRRLFPIFYLSGLCGALILLGFLTDDRLRVIALALLLTLAVAVVLSLAVGPSTRKAEYKGLSIGLAVILLYGLGAAYRLVPWEFVVFLPAIMVVVTQSVAAVRRIKQSRTH